MTWGTRKDGRRYKKHGKSSSTNMRSIKEQNRAHKATIRSLNYHGGDYTGPNPSRRSLILDRKRRNKSQPWENR